MKNPAWRAFGIFLLPLAAMGGELPPLQPPHAELPPTWWEQHGWFTVLAGIAGLVVVVLLIALLCRRKPPVVTPPDVLARRELEALRGSVENGALLVKVSGLLRRYVLHVCGAPPAELTTAELRETIRSNPQLGPGLAADINGFLRQCDERKFAPAPPAPPAGAVTSALALMDKIELARKPAADAPSQSAANAGAP